MVTSWVMVNCIGPSPSKPFQASKVPSRGEVGGKKPLPAPAGLTSQGTKGVPVVVVVQLVKSPVSKLPLTTIDGGCVAGRPVATTLPPESSSSRWTSPALSDFAT